MTTLARILDDLSGPTACRTRSGNAEKTLLESNLPVTAARGARGRPGTSLASAAVALRAGLMTRVLNLFLRTESGFFESQFEIVTKVRSTLTPFASTTATAKEIAESEDVAENVAEIGKDVGVESTETAGAANSGMTEAVIAGALLGVAEDSIGFSSFLELLFGFRVTGIAVRVILHREFAVSGFDLAVGRSSADAENLVVVPFGCAQKQLLCGG